MRRDGRRTSALLAVLVLVSFLLVTLDYRSGRGSLLDPVRAAAGRVLAPIESGVAAAVRPVGQALTRTRDAIRDSARVEQLERENARLRQQLAIRGGAVDRGAASRLLRLARTGGYRIVPARVVALGAVLGLDRTATIDAGTRDGIVRGLPVLTGDGLVGRVVAVTRTTATVLLAIDPASRIGVRVVRSGQVGLLSGQSPRSMALELVDPYARVVAGDRLVTFGSPDGRPYVAGVPVGTVARVNGTAGTAARPALVTPYVEFGALDLVGVALVAPTASPRAAIVPSRPDPVVRPSAPPAPSSAPSPAR